MKFAILSSLLAGTAMSAAVPNMDDLLNPLTADAFKKFHARGIDARQNKLAPQGVGALPATPPPFDPVAQRVSNTGANRFIAPGPNDARGPCPGLNGELRHSDRAPCTTDIEQRWLITATSRETVWHPLSSFNQARAPYSGWLLILEDSLQGMVLL